MMRLEPFQLLRVFISSPGDVYEERQIAEGIIQRINNSCRDTLSIHVESDSWEKETPQAGTPERTIQKIINERVEACQIFILILYQRYGTVEQGFSKSNTEREIDLVLEKLAAGHRTMFLAYFRELSNNADPGSQEKKVRQLRNRLSRCSILYKTYTTVHDFQNQLTHDLYHTILKYQMATNKRKILKAFWQLGVPEGSTHPMLFIVYPPVDRIFMKQDDPDKIWQKRLLPHVVFEDFKSLQKVEKTLRIIGFRDFEFFSISGAPADVQDRNRLWICLPRNELGLHQLSLYKDRARFDVLKGDSRREARILWKYSSDSKRAFTIHSPLGKYLREQRKITPGGNWHAQLGKIYAKDFAILARFSDKRDRQPMSYGTLKDYFIAGIRGLGTWGVGWFIDRRYNALKKYLIDDDCDVQILLEVTYKDEHILDVRDVSDEPESYFRKENNLRIIRTRIKQNF